MPTTSLDMIINGKAHDVGVINIFRIADGKVVEVWSEADQLGIMQRLGLNPPPPPAR